MNELFSRTSVTSCVGWLAEAVNRRVRRPIVQKLGTKTWYKDLVQRLAAIGAKSSKAAVVEKMNFDRKKTERRQKEDRKKTERRQKEDRKKKALVAQSGRPTEWTRAS